VLVVCTRSREAYARRLQLWRCRGAVGAGVPVSGGMAVRVDNVQSGWGGGTASVLPGVMSVVVSPTVSRGVCKSVSYRFPPCV
jgi:hypothetical protein